MNCNKIFKKLLSVTTFVASVLAFVGTAEAQSGLPRQEKLLNGLRVLMWDDARSDRVSVTVRVHSGSAFDPQGKEGVMQMLADSLFPSEASREFFTEDLGGSLDMLTTYDFIEVRASSKPEHFLTMLETVSTAVSNPQIDKEITRNLRSALITKLESFEREPAYVSDTAVAARLFGNFPYGRPQMGTVASVKKIDFADLIGARQRFLTADNATIAVTGKYDRALAFRAIRRYFGNWTKSDRLVPSTFTQPDGPPRGVLTIESPVPSKAAVRFAFRGHARGDKDFAVSLVFASLLEARLRSRVPSVHSDGVFVRSLAHTLPGSVVIGFDAGQNEVGAGPGKVDAGELITKALSEPISDMEFQAARSAVRSEWEKRDVPSFWLDADTYKIRDAEAYSRSLNSLTLSDLRQYWERVRNQPMASVLVSSPRESK